MSRKFEHAGKTGLVAAVAHALSQHAMCWTHVVWIKCGEIETETLSKAKAHLLPLVSVTHNKWPSSNLAILFPHAWPLA